MKSATDPVPPCISLRGSRATYFGPALDLAPHRCAVAVVVLSAGEPFDLAIFDHGAGAATYATTRAALVPPGRWHHVKARGPVAFVYLDALGDDYRAARQAQLDSAGELFRAHPPGRFGVIEASALMRLPEPKIADLRVAAALEELDLDPDRFASFAALAEHAGLSPSRCRALIRSATGVPFSRYRLWRRMERVARSLATGATLTVAAHAAGFASSAHLSAAFRAMFGLSPSRLLKTGVTFVFD